MRVVVAFLIAFSMALYPLIVSVGPSPPDVDDIEDRRPNDWLHDNEPTAYPPIVVNRIYSPVNWMFLRNINGTGYNDSINISATDTTEVEFADLNHDGHLDLISVNIRGSDSQIFWGDGSNNWSNEDCTDLDTEHARGGVAVGDYNGDTLLDIAFGRGTGTQWLDQQVIIFYNDGLGGFNHTPDKAIDGPGDNIDSGDLNGDGYCDIVSGNTSKTTCFLGGPGGPDAVADVTLDVGCHQNGKDGLVVSDLNDDGYHDVIPYGIGPKGVPIFLSGANGPDGVPEYNLSTKHDTPDGCAAGDINGDGYVDLVLHSFQDSSYVTQIFTGSTHGWSDAMAHDLSNYNGPIEVADINADEYDDVLTLNNRNGSLNVYFGGTGLPTTPNIVKDITSPTTFGHGIAVAEGAAYQEINATLPSVPLNLTAADGVKTINLTWEPPLDNGGIKLWGYQLFRGTTPDEMGPIGKVVSSTLSYTDTGMVWGVRHHYSIAAINLMGTSDRSDVVSAIAVANPTSPKDLTATGILGAVQLAWSPPAGTGGYPIVEYSISRGTSLTEIDEWKVLGNVTEYLDDDLGKGVVNYYKVRASNALLSGPYSLVVSASALGLPDPPEFLTADVSDSRVSLEWRAPRNDGGSQILGTRILRGLTKDALESHDIIDGSWTNFTDDEVENGRMYFYAVQVFTEVGDSPLSPIIEARPLGPPSPPEGIDAEIGDSSVTLTWFAPGMDGGSPVTGYRVYRGLAPDQMSSYSDVDRGTTVFSDVGLENGATYYYSVTAMNAVGEGIATGAISARPLGTLPPPVDFIAEASDGMVSLKWAPPGDTGGTSIISYSIYRGLSEGELKLIDTVDAETLSYDDEGRENGVTYFYAVCGITEAGLGHSSAVVITTPFGPPGVLTDFVATAGDDEVRLSWSPPHDDGASPVQGYILLRGITQDSLSQYANLEDVHAYQDTMVTNGKTYYYRLAARNEAGLGPMSQPVSATPETIVTPPGKVLTLVADAKGAKVTLQWNPPQDDGGSPVTGYVVYRGDSVDSMEVVANLGVVKTWTDDDVVRSRTYYYTVAALNEAGEGKAFAAFEVKVPKEKGESPGFLVLTVCLAILLILPIVRRWD